MSAMPISLSHLPPGSPPWAFALVVSVLVLHIGGGSIGILSGFAALWVRKGEYLHRAFGTVFFAAMLVMAAMATCLAILIHQKGNIAAGALTFYLVGTAWAAVRRKEGEIGLFERSALFVPIVVAALLLRWGVQATMSLNGLLDGFPAAVYYGFAFLAAFFAAMDLKVILQGGLFGAARIARHLWRMCCALFFAAASFFIGQQKVMPVWMHGSPLLLIPALTPIVALTYWLIRVRLTNWYSREPLSA